MQVDNRNEATCRVLLRNKFPPPSSSSCVTRIIVIYPFIEFGFLSSFQVVCSLVMTT